jgi:hypothetical protein
MTSSVQKKPLTIPSRFLDIVYSSASITGVAAFGWLLAKVPSFGYFKVTAIMLANFKTLFVILVTLQLMKWALGW